MERNESHSCVLVSVEPVELQPKAWRVLTILFSLLVFFSAWYVAMCSGNGLGHRVFGTEDKTDSFALLESRDPHLMEELFLGLVGLEKILS